MRRWQNWAFDRFYAKELGSAIFEAGVAPAIADALDALMLVMIRASG